MAVLRAATRNPVKHYGLPVGLLQPGDPADAIVVETSTTSACGKPTSTGGSTSPRTAQAASSESRWRLRSTASAP